MPPAMRVLSFDVGVINLAACLLDCTDQGCSVVFWDTLNLAESLAAPGCEVEGCGLPSKWQTPDGAVRLCGRHKGRHQPPPVSVIELSGAEPAPCEHAGKKPCGTAARQRVGELALCRRHAAAGAKAAGRAQTLVAVKPTRCGDVPLETLKLELWRRFDCLPQLLQADVVVIENQPSLKAPRMKSMAETLYNHFLCRGIVDRERTGSTVQAVKYVSACNKLKLGQALGPQEATAARTAPDAKAAKAAKAATAGARYRDTKSAGVLLCKDVLAACPHLLAVLDSHKKRDDMADALLQGLYYIRQTHGLLAALVDGNPGREEA